MIFNKGFAWLPILIVIGLLLAGGGVYFFNTNSEPTISQDMATNVGGWFWKDSSHVWYEGAAGTRVEIKDADAATFVYADNNTAKDARHTYSFDAKGYLAIDGKSTHVVDSSDIAVDSTAKVVTPVSAPFGCYAKTAMEVYDVGGVTDATSFPLPANSKVLPSADPVTFKEIVPYGVCFGMDKNHVYQHSSILSWADPATFKLLWYSKPGPVLFFRNGSKIVAYDTTIKNFTDVVGGDPTTFQDISGGYDYAPWAKDKNQFYCNGKLVQYSDPQTVHVTTDFKNVQVNVNGVQITYDSQCRTVTQ